MYVRLFAAFDYASRILFSPNLDDDPAGIFSCYQDGEVQYLTPDPDEEGTWVQVLNIQIEEEERSWKFPDQDIEIDEHGNAEVRTFQETPDETVHRCRIRLLMTRPVTALEVRKAMVEKLIKPA